MWFILHSINENCAFKNWVNADATFGLVSRIINAYSQFIRIYKSKTLIMNFVPPSRKSGRKTSRKIPYISPGAADADRACRETSVETWTNKLDRILNVHCILLWWSEQHSSRSNPSFLHNKLTQPTQRARAQSCFLIPDYLAMRTTNCF